MSCVDLKQRAPRGLQTMCNASTLNSFDRHVGGTVVFAGDFVIAVPPPAPPVRTLPPWIGQAARFGLVGGLAAGLDFGVLSLIIGAGGSRYAARIASVAISVVFTWALNRRLTFATAAPPSWREFGHYVAVAMAGIVLNLSIYWAALGFGAPTWLAFVLGTGITAVFSFFRYRTVLG